MGALDYLFNGNPPPAVTTSIASDSGLPDWYQEYIRGVAGQATNIAGQQAGQPAPQMSVAGLNNNLRFAKTLMNQNRGSYQPWMEGARGILDDTPRRAQAAGQGAVEAATGYGGRAADAATGYGQGAVGAASRFGDQATQSVARGPATWTQSWRQYMSPYTQGVVDNIARLGTRNFNENIMPGINAGMIGNGQFGSTRNADVLARAGRDVQADILGRQSEALQSGYGMGADIFAGDVQRQQAQQQMRSAAALGAGQNLSQANINAGNMAANAYNTAGQNIANANINAGQLNTQAGLGAASQMGALGQAYHQMGREDVGDVMGYGEFERGVQQQGYDTNYANALNANNYDWNILNNVNSAIRGMPLNASPVQVSNGPAQYYQPGALAQVGTGYSTMRS